LTRLNPDLWESLKPINKVSEYLNEFEDLLEGDGGAHTDKG